MLVNHPHTSVLLLIFSILEHPAFMVTKPSQRTTNQTQTLALVPSRQQILARRSSMGMRTVPVGDSNIPTALFSMTAYNDLIKSRWMG
jgi:hypothetical protein